MITTDLSKYESAAFDNEAAVKKNPIQMQHIMLHKIAFGLVSIFDKNTSIVDLGCGEGWFAERLYQNNYKNYLGIDFAGQAIINARDRVPQAIFQQWDIRKKGTKEQMAKYQLFIALEIMEHLKNDFDLIDIIPKGNQLIFSVPNVYHKGHVRYFDTMRDVLTRYQNYLSFKFISSLLVTNYGKQFFICMGTKTIKTPKF